MEVTPSGKRNLITGVLYHIIRPAGKQFKQQQKASVDHIKLIRAPWTELTEPTRSESSLN